MKILPYIFLDLDVRQETPASKPAAQVLVAFERGLLEKGVTLPSEVWCGDLHFSKPGTGLIRAYYSSNSLLKATIEMMDDGVCALRGRITVSGWTRAFLTFFLVFGTFVAAVLMLVSLAEKKFIGIVYSCGWEMALVFFVFLLCVPNYFLTVRQRRLILAAFIEAATIPA